MMIEKHNLAVRKAARVNDIPLYKVADLMGISESMLTKKIRYEWTAEEQNRVISLIEEYAKGGNDND